MKVDEDEENRGHFGALPSATQATVYPVNFSHPGTSQVLIAHSVTERLALTLNRQFPWHFIEARLSQNSIIEHKLFALKLVQSKSHERQILLVDFGAQDPTALSNRFCNVHRALPLLSSPVSQVYRRDHSTSHSSCRPKTAATI